MPIFLSTAHNKPGGRDNAGAGATERRCAHTGAEAAEPDRPGLGVAGGGADNDCLPGSLSGTTCGPRGPTAKHAHGGVHRLDNYLVPRDADNPARNASAEIR